MQGFLYAARSRTLLGASRGFSSSAAVLANRAVVYSAPGDPRAVLRTTTFPDLPHPAAGAVNVQVMLAPVNPSDINVVEGVYPARPAPTHALAPGHALPEPLFVAGNEGLARVTAVGPGVQGLAEGDCVVMAGQQLGTWASARSLAAEDVVKVPPAVSEVNAATMTVNPPTAYNMLHDFVKLEEGDWVMQNGANSAVGQAVIQIAAREGIKTLNFVRNRDNLDTLKEQLKSLGATEVLTYDELNDKKLRERVRTLTGGKEIRLLLNCVSGPATTHMVRLLGADAHLVSYGAMSKQPLALPTGAFIFKNLACHGFWQSRWYAQHSRAEREALLAKIAGMQLKEPEHEIVTIPAQESDAQATERVRSVMETLSKGQYGKKILLKIEQP